MIVTKQNYTEVMILHKKASYFILCSRLNKRHAGWLFDCLTFCVAIWVASDFTSPVGFYEVTFAHFDVILFAIERLIAILMLHMLWACL